MDLNLLEALSRGTVLGLAAGLSPGPLTILVISETLRHGLSSGVKVSLAPVLTDLPIILLAALLLGRLSAYPAALGGIALLGAGFLLHLGLSSLKQRTVAIEPRQAAPHSLLRGVAANFLNPNPYVFWIGVGTPILLSLLERSWMNAAAFMSAFFLCIVGSKLLLARIADRSRAFLSSGAYRWVMRCLGVLLIVYAIFFFTDGLARIGFPMGG
jgi:threonine/homoserine/homoserine lactone efflux protein